MRLFPHLAPSARPLPTSSGALPAPLPSVGSPLMTRRSGLAWLQCALGGWWLPEGTSTSSPGNLWLSPYLEKGLCRHDEVEISRQLHLGLGWALDPVTGVPGSDSQGGDTRGGRGHVSTEAEVGVTRPRAQDAEDGGNTRAFQRSQPCPHLVSRNLCALSLPARGTAALEAAPALWIEWRCLSSGVVQTPCTPGMGGIAAHRARVTVCSGG